MLRKKGEFGCGYRSHLVNGQLSKLLNSGSYNLVPALKAPPHVSPGNALGFGIDRCALQGRRNPPPFQGGRGTSDTFPRRCPGLECSAHLARQRG